MVGAVLEDAVDQLAIISATFGPAPDTHINTMRAELEGILVRRQEEEQAGPVPPGADIRQLQCETAYIQRVQLYIYIGFDING